MKNIFLTLIVLMFLSGCVGLIPEPNYRYIPTTMYEVDKMIGNQPLEYKQGFRDGCDSGMDASGNMYSRFSKDVTRYNNDNLYKQGWDDGCDRCKTSNMRVRRVRVR